MKNLKLALAMVAMLLVGMVAGAIILRPARADSETAKPQFELVILKRTNPDDPIALQMNNYNGNIRVIYKDGTSREIRTSL